MKTRTVELRRPRELPVCADRGPPRTQTFCCAGTARGAKGRRLKWTWTPHTDLSVDLIRLVPDRAATTRSAGCLGALDAVEADGGCRLRACESCHAEHADAPAWLLDPM